MCLVKGRPGRNCALLKQCVRVRLERLRQDKAKACRARGTLKTAAAALATSNGLSYDYPSGECETGSECPYQHARGTPPPPTPDAETPGVRQGRGGLGARGVDIGLTPRAAHTIASAAGQWGLTQVSRTSTIATALCSYCSTGSCDSGQGRPT